MQIQILNSFRGDATKDIDTETDEGRAAAAKLVGELIKSGSAIFLEREIDGETRTYRVTGYDPATDRLSIQIPTADFEGDTRKDKELAAAPLKRGRKARNLEAAMPSNSGRAVSVAPVSGGILEEEEKRELTWAGIRYGMSKISEERGWHHGCPMPSTTDTGARLVIAPGAPLADKMVAGLFGFGMGEPITHTCSHSDIDEDPPRMVNSWTPEVTRVDVYRDSKQSWKVRWPYTHERMMFWLRTMRVRAGAVDWETEITAMRALQDKITDGQWGSYVLNGAFPEKSCRSGITYILRKGMPTLAITERPRAEGGIQIRFLAALCLHPLAYYEGTWAGAQPPTDEVMAHLMLIRADEHFFWRKSGQHPITAPQAAV